MTERGRGDLARTVRTFRVGPSMLDWDGTKLEIRFDERTSPMPTGIISERISGRITVWPEALSDRALALDPAGRHHWQPIAPSARVEVATDRPGFAWSGHGYFDTNSGSEMLEDGFRRWDWSRAETPEGAAILYDMTLRDGQAHRLAMAIARDGAVEPFDPPDRRRLRRGYWGVERWIQSEHERPKILRAMEDSPFYTRASVATRLAGHDVTAVHETLDCRRFANPVVRMMLPVRMPRRPSRR